MDADHFKGIDRNSSGIQRWLDLYYMGLTTITTIGYGDITPASFHARMLVMLYILVLIVGFFF
jgi:hypothetical protein